MDQETPRELGDIEDTEPDRPEPGRSVPLKKSLDDFLAEFEQRLRDSPGEAATSAPAALEGRAQGVWRTPVESGERSGRRPARRPPWRPDADQPRDPPAPPPPVPATGPDPVVPVAEPVALAGETKLVIGETPPDPTALGEPLPAPALPADADVDTGATPAGETEELAAATGDGPGTGRKRHRRQRRHRRH